ncbi:hypothetical protein [Evansella cellulosilytica]|uniref:Uncharacterized protein n=1 Tax=Evansella cellulosilytica (strain ATCC 21833 / DSM 2522 / FERM P-1141 / JCM 9156 / N-4) TaxID=649639 RepID=E6TTL8_EVAC2|nr:hypothetical protein [Evansella cellulosilytica]ADU29654.1 hypothetical protein Bcell_1389 [Evansella cellulosilytica DSM 2522]
MKVWLTPICFLLIPVFYVWIRIVDFHLASFFIITTLLTVLGAYFTKHLPPHVDDDPQHSN